jgi:hypothetical protein
VHGVRAWLGVSADVDRDPEGIGLAGPGLDQGLWEQGIRDPSGQMAEAVRFLARRIGVEMRHWHVPHPPHSHVETLSLGRGRHLPHCITGAKGALE